MLQTLTMHGDQFPPLMAPPASSHQQSLNNGGAVVPVMSPFHSTIPPQIPVQAYFVYVSINAGLSDEQAVVTLVLIERLCIMATQRGVPININSLTIHR